MTTVRSLPQSFVAGVLSARMHGRPDDIKYQHGAARVHNFHVETTGAVRRQPGREFVDEARNHNKRMRLLRFRAAGFQELQLTLNLRQEFPATSGVPGAVRFYRDGLPVRHSAAWSAATAYQVGDTVFDGGQLYACKTAHTNQQPPANVWRTLEYVQNRTLPAVANPAAGAGGIFTGAPGQIEFGTGNNHNLEDDEPILFTGEVGATAPAGITYNTIYYAEIVNPTRIRLRAIPGSASFVTITDAGTVGHRMHRSYTTGELVSQSGSVFYCRSDRPIDANNLSIPPTAGNEVFWYLEPATGQYEIPANLGVSEDQLFGITAHQERLALTLCSQGMFISEVVAVPPGTTHQVDYTQFHWRQVSLQPPLAAPTGVVGAVTKAGDTLELGASINNGGAMRLQTTSEHHLTGGLDHVFITGTGNGTLDNKQWSLDPVNGQPKQFDPIDPDTGQYVVFAAFAAGGKARVVRLNSTASNSYQVTSVDSDGRESAASATVVIATNNLFANGAINTVSWSPVAGAVRYRVYKLAVGTALFGLIGETTGTSFQDSPTVLDTSAPNLGKTPPRIDTGLISATTATNLPTAVELKQAPQAVTHFESRRVFGGTDAEPTGVWATRSNTESDLSYQDPIQATDRIHQDVKADGTIRHLLPLGQLIALTDTSEVRITPASGDALTPNSFVARTQNRNGAGPAQPVIMHNAGWFVGGRGGRLYAIGFREDEGGFVSSDQCERASHLFDGRAEPGLVQLAAQIAPVPITWAVSTDGILLGMTNQPRQQVFAWHTHGAGGTAPAIESVSCGGEGAEDRIYCAVRRTIGGQVRRYLERFRKLTPGTLVESCYLDSAVVYTGPPVTNVTNGAHLNGETVQVFADGVFVGTRLMVGGAFDAPLATPASPIAFGLPLPAELHTLPAAFAIEAYGSGKTKNINKLWLRVEQSGAFKVGTQRLPDGTVDVEAMVIPPQLATLAPGTTFSGLVEVTPPHEWGYDGQVFVLVDTPVPVTITSITAEMALAG